jgi:hypothetical protein
MAQKRPGPTQKDSLTVRQSNLVRESVVEESFTTPLECQARYLEQSFAGNVAEILEA